MTSREPYPSVPYIGAVILYGAKMANDATERNGAAIQSGIGTVSGGGTVSGTRTRIYAILAFVAKASRLARSGEMRVNASLSSLVCRRPKPVSERQPLAVLELSLVGCGLKDMEAPERREDQSDRKKDLRGRWVSSCLYTTP